MQQPASGSSKGKGTGAGGLALSWAGAGVALEVAAYALVLGSFYGSVVPAAAAEVTAACRRFQKCRRWLGTAPLGYSTDLADTQWSSFRRSVPLLLLALAVVPLLHFLVRRWTRGVKLAGGSVPVSSLYHLIVGLVFLGVYHGFYAAVILAFGVAAYAVGRVCRASVLNPVLTWALALSVIVIKESYRFPMSSLGKMTAILFVPGFGGMYPWKFAANFLILRIISYNMDYYWALKQGAQAKKEDDAVAKSDAKSASSSLSPEEQQQLTAEEHYALIVKEHRPLAQYNLINFIAYILYAPLYVAGPILPFNAFVAQMERPQTHRSKKEVLFYAVRWFVWLALMETLTHYYPFFAVTYSGVFRTLSPRQLAVTAYMTLKLMWLKFFLMWRFFRLWAMVDGVETAENMPRCMSNNYSLQGFWRQWHSSYNQWLVRYMYVPLGGRERRSLSVWLVFLFVGLWHDAEVKLVAWGLLNSVFFVIENQATRLVKMPSMRWLTESGVFPIVQAMAAGLYIMVLIAVNLVGYSVGVGGVWYILKRFLQEPYYATLLGSFAYLVGGASFMFFLRRHKLCAP